MEKKTIFKTMMVAACCLGAAVFASCDKDNDNNRSNGLRLSADRITVAPGATASVTVANAAQPLTVKSTDEKTATAKADKNTVTVTGVKEGKASVIVTDKNRQTATVAVTVAKPLAFDKTELKIDAGKEGMFTVKSGKAPYTVTVRDKRIATATVKDATVTVKGVKKGTTTVSVLDKEKLAGTVTVTVN